MVEWRKPFAEFSPDAGLDVGNKSAQHFIEYRDLVFAQPLLFFQEEVRDLSKRTDALCG
jgi:hypothetical protein